VFVFESLYLLLSGFVFIPFIAWIFDRFMGATGNKYLLNDEVLKFALDFRGLASFLILGSLMSLMFFLELGVLLILAQKIYYGSSVTLMDSLATVIRKIPKILGIGLVSMFMLLLLITPLIDSPITDFLFKGVNLDIVIFNQFRQSRIRLTILLGLSIAAFLLLSRFIFALHLIIIRGLSMRKALTTSWKMTSKRHFKTVITLITGNLVYFGLALSILLVLNYLPLWLQLSDRFVFIKSATMVFTSYLVFVLTLLIIPINMSVITRLYYRFASETGKDIPDDLILAKSGLAGWLETRLGRFLSNRKKLLRLILILLLTVTFLINTRIYDQWIFARWHVMIAAHRGDPVQAPENTLPAIEAAIQQAADYVEIDVQLSADGVPVLFHDASLYRIDGSRRLIKDLTLEEIQQVDAGSWFSPEFAGTQIPTLEESINMIAGRCNILIDIKLTDEPERVAGAVVYLIEQYDLTGSSLIQSFSPRVLAEIRKLNEDIGIGQILSVSAGRLDQLDVDFYTINQTMLTESFVRTARRQGRQIWVWTVNSKQNIRTVLSYDINGIITDYPQRVLEVGGFGALIDDQTPVPLLTEESTPAEM
jgi:glycerophosphoryl diester phosphodiesterase